MNEDNREEQLQGQLMVTEEQPPLIAPKSGYATSQGQMTAIFTLVCMILAFFGITIAPEQIESWVATAERLAAILVPIIAAAWSIVNYTNSRGKIESNSLWANAAIQSSVQKKTLPVINDTISILNSDEVGIIKDLAAQVLAKKQNRATGEKEQ